MLIKRFCKKSEAKRAIYAVPRNNCTYKLLRVGFDSLLLRQIKKEKHPSGELLFFDAVDRQGSRTLRKAEAEKTGVQGTANQPLPRSLRRGKSKRAKRACADSLLLRQETSRPLLSARLEVIVIEENVLRAILSAF